MIIPDATQQFKPLPKDDPTRRKPDITRAKEWLGWEPKVPLQEGLVPMIEDFRQRLGAEVTAPAATSAR